MAARRPLADLDREAIERFVAHLASDGSSLRSRRLSIGALHRFLLAIRQHRWDQTLPAGAVVHPEDYPRLAPAPPRALSEAVMAQLESPTNLALFAESDMRLMTMILMGTGLRIGDALQLAFDCIVRDAQHAPYLRYWNHKMKREGLVPIDDELAALIAEQQQQVLARWPEPQVLLPRWQANPDGRWPLPVSTYRVHLKQWVAACNVRDEHGRPVQVQPHQWRHTSPPG